MVGVILKDQWLLFNNSMALLADIFPQATSFLTVVAWATKVPGVNGKGRTKFRSVEKESVASNNVLTYSVTAAQNSIICSKASE